MKICRAIDLGFFWRKTYIEQGIGEKRNSMENKNKITDAHQYFRPKRKLQGTKTGMRLRIRKLLHSFSSVENSNKEEV